MNEEVFAIRYSTMNKYSSNRYICKEMIRIFLWAQENKLTENKLKHLIFTSARKVTIRHKIKGDEISQATNISKVPLYPLET